MPRALDERVVRDALESRWHVRDIRELEPRPEAMNSLVWLVEYGEGERLVVKAVEQAGRLESGLVVASEVERRGMRTGAALPADDGALTVPADDGALTVPADDWSLAVLSYVPGRPLDPANSRDAETWGTTLGRLHHILLDLEEPAQADRWPWFWPAADDAHLLALPDVRAAVVETVAEARRAADRSGLTSGTLHPDPGRPRSASTSRARSK